MMLIPEAWAGNPLMDRKRRAFPGRGPPAGDRLLCAYYLNELVLRLLGQGVGLSARVKAVEANAWPWNAVKVAVWMRVPVA